MAVRGGFSPSSGLMCEIVNSVSQGKFREFQKPVVVATMIYCFRLWGMVEILARKKVLTAITE